MRSPFLWTIFNIFIPEEKKFRGTKDLAGPWRFLTVDGMGSTASWTKSSKSRAPLATISCILLVYLVDFQFPGVFFVFPENTDLGRNKKNLHWDHGIT